jgi:hypothetical protein
MTGADLLALIKKQPIAFACAFVALACGVLFYFRSDALDEARQHFEAKDTEAKKMEVNVRHLAGLPEDTAQVQEAGRQFESRLVRAGQLATNLQFFYRIESETGVKLLDVRQNPIPPPKAGSPRTAYSPVPFALSVQGTFSQIYSFLRQLETGPNFSRFTQVTLSKVDPLTAAAANPSAPAGLMSANLQIELLGTP